MHRIHQLVKRSALIAAAAVLAGSLSARSASASTLYQTNFSTYNDNGTMGTYTNGPIGGQDSFATNPSPLPAGESATVSTSAQTLALTRTTGNTILAGPTDTSYTSATPFTINSAVTVTIPTFSTTGTNGPVFGLDVFGNGGTTNIASLVYNSVDGTIENSEGSGLGSTNNLSPDPGPFAAGTAVNLDIQATFAGGTVSLNYYVDGVLADTETTSAVSFYSSEFLGTTGYDTGVDSSAAVTADFSGYSVTESVPEPASLGMVGVAGILLALRRSRRPIAAI